MAEITQPQLSVWDQFMAMFNQGDNDTSGAMTVPTALNTSQKGSPPGAGAVPAGARSGLGTGLGMNVGTGQLALSGLEALAGIWDASQQNKLAKEQFSFQKDLANTNMNNQMKSYNTALEDRMTTRGAMEGRDAAYTASEIDRRKLSR